MVVRCVVEVRCGVRCSRFLVVRACVFQHPQAVSDAQLELGDLLLWVDRSAACSVRSVARSCRDRFSENLYLDPPLVNLDFDPLSSVTHDSDHLA